MSLHISHNTKSVRIIPKTQIELRSLIEQELECQGPDADLNFIDTSEMTDMYKLFYGFPIRNIKIDKWDTSKVIDMMFMFAYCKNFDCDLSEWDISNVVYTDYMFEGCYNCTIDHRPQVSHYTRLTHSTYKI